VVGLDCGIEQSGSVWWPGRGRGGVDRARTFHGETGRGRLGLRPSMERPGRGRRGPRPSMECRGRGRRRGPRGDDAH
jgi:hypothetical protein